MCHVAMVAKFLDLNTTVFLQTWYEKTKKIDLYDFPLHDCTKEQSGNKTAHGNNTAIKWPDKPLWGTCAYREHQKMGYFSSDHAVKKSSSTLFLKKKQRCGRNKPSTVFLWSLKHPHKKKKNVSEMARVVMKYKKTKLFYSSFRTAEKF